VAIAPQALQFWAKAILERAGAASAAADAVARCLVDANVRGVDSHGIVLLAHYLPRLRSGAVAGDARPEVVRETTAVALVDGHDGLGAYVATFAMDLCCDKAAEAGAAVVVVRNSSHFGAASCFSEQAARRGLIGIAMTNAEPGLAPPGGVGPVLGTNPLAIAAPAGPNVPPVSLDVATSVVAQNRLFIAAARGDAIERGWAMGPDGEATEDPKRALEGAMLPAGGHKGFGLAFMIDVLAACLPGAVASPGVKGGKLEHERVGHFFLAVRPGAIRNAESFSVCVQDLVEAVHRAPRADGVERFLVPGEREARIAASRGRKIPLDESTVEELESLGQQFRLPFVLNGESQRS
jgi:LDH2 family malate/lactate/ureidoglycolate dehydrogenase